MRHRIGGVVVGTMAGINALMAGGAGCGQGVAAQSDAGETMAIGTFGRPMRARQRKTDGRVIEHGAVRP